MSFTSTLPLSLLSLTGGARLLCFLPFSKLTAEQSTGTAAPLARRQRGLADVRSCFLSKLPHPDLCPEDPLAPTLSFLLTDDGQWRRLKLRRNTGHSAALNHGKTGSYDYLIRFPTTYMNFSSDGLRP